MFNREFVLGGILDLRVPTLLFGLIILIQALIRALRDNDFVTVMKNLEINKKILLVNSFFLLVFFSNFMWLFNGLEIDFHVFISILLIAVYNYIFVLVIQVMIDVIDLNKIVKYLNISFFFLFVSILLVFFGLDLRQLIGHSFRFDYVSYVSMPFNITRRISGFADDPNYVSFFSVMIILVNLKFKPKKMKIMIFLTMVAIILSFSRTVMLAMVLIAVILLFEKLLRVINKRAIYASTSIILSAIILVPISAVIFNFNTGMTTLDQRFSMWNNAISLFLRNPLFGSGLTSFRSYFSISGGWFVQPHSTYFSILSENGLIAFVLFLLILFNQLKLKNKYHSSLVLVFAILGITQDITYHSYFVFISVLLYYITVRSESKIIDDSAKQNTKFNLERIERVEDLEFAGER